jgi:hypothetical protein
LGADVRVAKVKIWNIVAEELQIILIDSQGVILYFDFISTVLPVIEISPTFSGPHTGNALAGYVQSGTYVYANETLAKDACKARGDCNGVTQEPKNYTLRAGTTLTGSSTGEDSWQKTITFTGPHANNALAGYVSSGTYVYANETAAKDACTARVDCNGVTRQTSRYTLRAGSTLAGSLTNEVSWNKVGSIRKVRVSVSVASVQMNLREVQVLDQNGNNVALNKTATQSSTKDVYGSASYAVDGNVKDYGSMTNKEGK